MEFSSKQLQKHNEAVKLQYILTFTFWTGGKRCIFPVFTSLLVQIPLERIKTNVIFNKSYPGKASERSNSIIEQVDFLSISLLSVSSKDRNCLLSPVRIFFCYWRHLEILALTLLESEAALLGKWADPCVCLFLPFLRVLWDLLEGLGWIRLQKKNTPKETWNGLFCRLNHLKSCES